ncbi:MAG TPA: hypothetical protein VIY53_10330 [Acidobacteriaceae bacterium]
MKNREHADGQHGAIHRADDPPAKFIIVNQKLSSSHTSNDLWSQLNAEHPAKAMNYEVVVQNADEVRDLRNAPPFSMADYLAESGQTQLLTAISIYTERGTTRTSCGCCT